MRETNNRSVSSLVDDDAMDIIDSLEEDDAYDDIDELFGGSDQAHASSGHSPSKGQSAVAIKPEPVKPATDDSAKDEGGSRIAFYRALQGFLQAMSEAAPLYLGERARNPDATTDELRQRVGELCGKHLSLVERCLTVNNANTQDVMLRYQRRTLARNLADLYAKNSMQELEGMVEVAKHWSLQSKDFESSGAETATGDSWLTVKLALFTATLAYHKELDGLWFGHTQAEIMLELQRLAISLSKEVAYSWSKRSQVSDREGLFSSALPHCLNIALKAYTEVAISYLGGDQYNALNPEPSLPLFEAAVEEMSFGYEDESLEALKLKVSKMASHFVISTSCASLNHQMLLNWRNAMLEETDKAMASAWEEATLDLIDELKEMSEEEQDAYYEQFNEMDFTRFEVRAVERLASLDRPGRMISVDFTEVTLTAKKHLAWLWGVSDSLIAARKENLPGE